MTWLVWIGFLAFVLTMVLLDLGVFHRKAHSPSVREALIWTCVWIVMALAFNVVVYFLVLHGWYKFEYFHGESPATITPQQHAWDAATAFFTGYVVEKSLSVDNIFVIAMIFGYFAVPLAQQHRVLFWGIMGAIVLRGIMIWLGSALIHNFTWIIYVFGALMLFSAAKMLVVRHDNIDPDRNWLVRLTRLVFPVTGKFHGSDFFVRDGSRWVATPLLLALVMVETSDVIFAVDSIPAVFAITTDPFIVFTSNIFAILGLRSLFFVLAGFMDKFRYLKASLVFILAYVGVKMLLSHSPWKIGNVTSLAVIAGALAVGVIASLIADGRDRKKNQAAHRQSMDASTDGAPPLEAQDQREPAQREG